MADSGSPFQATLSSCTAGSVQAAESRPTHCLTVRATGYLSTLPLEKSPLGGLVKDMVIHCSAQHQSDQERV